jgi:hypothetical protein
VFISGCALYCFLLFGYVMQVLAGCFSAVVKLLSVVVVVVQHKKSDTLSSPFHI